MIRKLDSISVVIVARNEEEKLPACLESVKWVSEIVVVDNDSTDKTVEIAKRYDAKIYTFRGGDFSERKNFALEKVKSKWVLFVDADERVTKELRIELEKITSSDKNFGAYAIPRRNYIFGKEFKYSNQRPDWVVRFFKRSKLIKVRLLILLLILGL